MRIERISRQSYVAGTEQRAHEHEHALLSIVLRGSLTETVDGRERRASVGDVLVKPRGVVHANHYGTGAVVGSIVLADDAPRYQLNQLDAGALVTRILHAHSAGVDVGDELADLEAALEHPEAPRPSSNAKMADVARMLATTVMSVEEIARAYGMHRVAMARSFRRAYGSSLTHYRLRARARRAAELLSGSKAPISDIALDAGFADQSHLCRVFRSEMGVTPRTFRRLAS